jgi:predicted PurR-regulated permease PerM
VLVVYVAVAGVFSLMGRLLAPALTEQYHQFMDQLPRLIDNVKGWLGDLQFFFGQWGASLPAPKADNVQGLAGSLLGNALRVTTGALGAVFELLAILVIAAYLVIDAREVGHTLLALLPAAHRPTARRLTPAVMDRIGGYVRGQLVSSFFVGVLIAIALSLIGVQLNDACYMTPAKSISLLVGAGLDARVDHYFSQCARCWMRDCAYRRAPARQTVHA